MQALPNAAETALAEVIRRQGRPGFESALLAFLGRAVAPDNLIVLAYQVGASYFRTFQATGARASFGQGELGASVGLACGHGFLNPGYQLSPQFTAFLAEHQDVAAGLLDEAVDHAEAKPGALPDAFGAEEGFVDLVLDRFVDTGPGV